MNFNDDDDFNQLVKESSKKGNEYKAFGRSLKNGCRGIRIIYNTGLVELLYYSFIGKPLWNPHQNTLLIPAMGSNLIITGMNLLPVIDLLQYGECEFLQELPKNFDSAEFLDNDPVIINMQWKTFTKDDL